MFSGICKSSHRLLFGEAVQPTPYLSGFPGWLPKWCEYSSLSALPATQKRDLNGYRQSRSAERWSIADLQNFPVFSHLLSDFGASRSRR
jgi:hypothetical protein